MTEKEARELLAGPLRFGDPNQIRAIGFLHKVEVLKEALQKHEVVVFPCANCGGDGEDAVECHCVFHGDPQPDCPDCEGLGLIPFPCRSCCGTGYELAEFDDEQYEQDPNVIAAAVKGQRESAQVTEG